MTSADLHVHSNFSPDSSITPEEIIREANRKAIDVICITDHSLFEENIAIEKYKTVKKPLIIRAVELATNNGELLIYGLKNNFWKELITGFSIHPRTDMVIDAVKSFGGIAVWSHPFRSYVVDTYDTNYTRFGFVKAIEGLNGKNTIPENNRAMEYARKNGYQTTGGSDAHTASEIGSCLTIFREKIESEQDFLEALKHSEYFPLYYPEFKGKDLSQKVS